MADLAYYVAGFLAILTGVVKLLGIRGRSLSRLYLGWALVCLGLAGVVLAPATLRAAASVEPIPNLARLIGNALSAGAVFCTVGMLVFAAHSADDARRRTHRQAGILAATVTAMAVLLIVARTQFTVDFVDAYAAHPVVAAYEVVFLSYVTWGLIGIALLTHQIARHAQRTFLRAGLRILIVGTLVGLCWSLWKIAASLLKVTTRQPIPVEGAVSSLLSATSILLIALGATVTAWGPRAAFPIRWLRARWICHRIEPLWSVLHAAAPDLEFDHPGAGIEFRLYHRIVEIRDSSLLLRTYVHPDATAWALEAGRAAGIDREAKLAVLVEAANIAAALEAHQVRHRYHDDPSTAAVPRDLDPDLDAEAHWLVRVAAAFDRSPVVEQVRRRVRAELERERVSGPESATG